MFQALSHRKKVLLVAGVVAAIALCDVVFEMSWVSDRPAVMPAVNEVAVPPVAAEVPRPLCDVAACAAAYRTFQASDCTYMPSRGVRRLCTKGRPPP